MGNTRRRAQQARQKVQDQFRRIFPKEKNFLRKKNAEPAYPKVARPRIPSLPPPPAPQPGLTVSATIRFEDSIQDVSCQAYNPTDQLDVSEKLINALIYRIDHCTNEMITRADPEANVALRHTDPRVKPARFHILYQVCRDGEPIWDRYYTSYQHTAVTRSSAEKIELEIDSIIAMFLLHHDPGFEWCMPAPQGYSFHGHRSTAPEFGRPQDMHCIPMVDEPAFSVDVALRSKIRGRETIRAFKVDSSQSTPLTLRLGEDMLSELSDMINSTKTNLESRFSDAHETCNGLEGSYGCRHIEEGAFELIAKVHNNFGPDYGHLADLVRSHRRLVHPADAEDFLDELHEQVEGITAKFDELSSQADDLVITIHELRSYNWAVKHPLKIAIGSSAYRNRATTEKLLQRLQAGMFDVLKGHGTVGIVTAHKRGHLVLKTTICRGEDLPYWDMGVFENRDLKKRVLQRRLRDRITKDLAAICKDTIRLEPLSGTVGIEVILPEDPEVVPLSEDAHARVGQRQSANDARGADGEASDENAGDALWADFDFMASFVSRDDSEMDDHQSTSFLSNDTDDGARTPQCTPPRSSYRLTTPVQQSSEQKSENQGVRTPVTPSEWLAQSSWNTPEKAVDCKMPLSLTKPTSSRDDDGEGTRTALAQGNDSSFHDCKKIDDDRGSTHVSPCIFDGFVEHGAHRLSRIEEEDDAERSSVQTVIFAPLEEDCNATSLLASMTADNIKASDIPGFKPTRCWAGEDGPSAHPGAIDSKAIDPERTITPALFHQNGPSVSRDDMMPKSPTPRDSDESLRRALLGPSAYEPMNLSGIAETNEDGKEAILSDGRDLSSYALSRHDTSNQNTPVKTQDNQLSSGSRGSHSEESSNQSEEHLDSRAFSEETNPTSNDEAPDNKSTVPLEMTTSSGSSQSSQPLRVFPRRRSDQNPVEPSQSQAFGNPHRRRATCPVSQRLGLHDE